MDVKREKEPMMTPGQVAQLDQDMTEANDRINRTVAMMRTQAAGSGEPQAAANTALALTMLPEGEISLLLLAALYRIAFMPGE